MKIATAAFMTATVSSSCGIVRPALSSSTETIADTTMNSALRMLLPAMMRERCVGAERVWITAYSGTM